MTVHMPPSLGQLMSMAMIARCKLSLDLARWGVDVEQRVGPKLWEGHEGSIPSPLRQSFWAAVAQKNDIDLPHVDAQQLKYHENLLALAVEVRLRDDTLTKLYRLHHGAKLIYDEIIKEKV